MLPVPKSKKNHWIESRWSVSADEAETLQSLLTQMGSLGNYENVPLDDAGNPCPKQQIELIAYFPDTKNLDDLAQKLRVCESVRANGCSPQLLVLNRIPQDDWATEWKKYFKPFFLTPEIVIRPSWEEYQAQGQEKVIVIDPGMAFGTGQHDTTKFCAELICELKHDHPELKSLIDVGCGSGILSFIAKKVGFSDVVGFDIDPESIEACEENLERNKDLGEIDFLLTNNNFSNSPLLGKELVTSVTSSGPQSLLSREGFSVVVANIIAETLCEMKDQLLNLMAPRGFLILSGIMTGREKMIAETFGDMELVAQKDSNDWHATLYRKK